MQHPSSRLLFMPVVVVLLVFVSRAYAVAPQRTFVSTGGNDANPCSLVAPCRGFAAAVTAAASGGEVIVLDSGGYGPVTIGKSITITAPGGVYAGISVISGDGITIAGTNIRVTLRGLTIHGQGGNNGIVFTDGDSLIVERVTIDNMNQGGVVINGTAPLSASLTQMRIERTENGIFITSAVNVTIVDSQISYNNNSAITIGPANGGGTAQIQHNLIDHNFHGIVAYSLASPPGVLLTIYSSGNRIVDSGVEGIFGGGTAASPTIFYVSDSNITSSTTYGIESFDSNVFFVLANNLISGNGSGGIDNKGGVYTMGNNVVRDNPGGNIIGGPLTPLTFN